MMNCTHVYIFLLLSLRNLVTASRVTNDTQPTTTTSSRFRCPSNPELPYPPQSGGCPRRAFCQDYKQSIVTCNPQVGQEMFKKQPDKFERMEIKQMLENAATKQIAEWEKKPSKTVYCQIMMDVGISCFGGCDSRGFTDFLSRTWPDFWIIIKNLKNASHSSYQPNSNQHACDKPTGTTDAGDDVDTTRDLATATTTITTTPPAPEQEDRERRDEKNVLLFGLDLLELVTIVVLIIVAVSVVTAVIAILLCLRSKRRQPTEGVELGRTTTASSENPIVVPTNDAFLIPFDQITIGPVIAAGGQGQIRRGQFSGQNVAIKELMRAMMNPNDVKELEAEATMLCSLHHPNIVRFYGMSVQTSPARGPSYYLITDLKDTDLRKFLEKEGQPAPREIFRIAIEICAALEYLHGRKMVHRDLKPANVLLDAGLTVFLCDFGLTKAYKGKGENVDMTVNLGTAAYMAPELSNLKNFAKDFGSIEDSGMAETLDGTKALADKHGFESKPAHFSVADSEAIDSDEENSQVLRDQKKIFSTTTDSASKVDCYAFSLVLWAMLSWQLPFRNLTPMQILVAVGYHKQRPPTQDIAKKWNPAVIELMRQMWHAAPGTRPTIVECKRRLEEISKTPLLNRKAAVEVHGVSTTASPYVDPDMAELRDDYGEDLEDDYAIAPEVMRDTDDSTTKSASSEDPDKKIHDAATAAPHVDPDMTELLDDYGESP